MEKMTASVLLAYSISLLLGEGIGDRMYDGKKWHRYSGLCHIVKAEDTIE